MTYDQFLSRLRETPRDWTLTHQGEIRRRDSAKGGGEVCPVCALHPDYMLGYSCAAEDIGLCWRDASSIAAAADNYGDPSIRRDLLLACGLIPLEG
jgi:hypothetical protein